MPKAGPWYLTWIDPPDPAALRNRTAFDPAVHNRMDEFVFSHLLTLGEGNMPRLRLVIRNPHIGLLNDSRKQWAFYAREIDGVITPVFCGRLVAAPQDIFKEKMTIDLIAWPLDYPEQRQRLVQEIKANGPYDPIWLDVTKRDDLDALLEAVSGKCCIDPVTHVVTISDLLNGEDGNIDVSESQHLYKDMTFDFDRVRALTQILGDFTVTWNQTAQGLIDMGSQWWRTIAGDAVISEWPKPLTQIGGGYSIAASGAVDVDGINAIVIATISISWTNKEKEHSEGDQLTASWSVTAPVGAARGEDNFLKQLLTHESQTGLVDAFATDGNGDPSPTNIPGHDNVTYVYCPVWTVRVWRVLQYRDLERSRIERVQMLLQSDLQAIIVRPEVEQNSETIVRTGADVGIPIVDLLARSGLSGHDVEVGWVLFADNPSVPGLRTAQIVTEAGKLADSTPANYSDIPGETTFDGTATLASLGTPAPTETAVDWPSLTNVGVGTIILPRKPLWLTWAQLTRANRQQVPPVGTQISIGTIIQDQNGKYHVCVQPGLSLTSEPAFGGVRGNVTDDGSAQWKCIGDRLPDGKTHFVAIQGGKTGEQFLVPLFNTALHAQTIDAGVIWVSIGPGVIPAGGTVGDVPAPCFFPTKRGNESLEYAASILRARGRYKARAVTIGFRPVDSIRHGLLLTLRKTATLHDRRLGGGLGLGKIIAVEHSCAGRREAARVQIGCAIGKDNVVEAAPGNPTYCEGYCIGYRAYTETIKVIGDASDIGYTPPLYVPNDDGLVFPLTKDQIVISEGIRGSLDEQRAAVQASLSAMAQAAKLAAQPTASIAAAAMIQDQIRNLSGNSIARATALNPIYYDSVLKPASGHSFTSFYRVSLTKLTCPRGIDLGAASTP